MVRTYCAFTRGFLASYAAFHGIVVVDSRLLFHALPEWVTSAKSGMG